MRVHKFMRRIPLDEGVPIGVRDLLSAYQVESVPDIGLAGLTNGDLIRSAEADGFEVMVTCDQNMRCQQNLTGRRLAIIVLTTNHWDTIRTNSESVLPAIESSAPGSLSVVAMPKPPPRRRRYPRPQS